MSTVRIRAAGDAALRVELPASLDVTTNERIVALADAVRSRFAATIRDVVIGYHTLTVYFDPLRVDRRWLEDTLADIAADPDATPSMPGGLIEVPVCYEGEFGVDLEAVAAVAGCTAEEVIELHSSREYRVFVVGFVPGFAYMGILDPRLATIPRRESPRIRVPAGSVAIAAGQTGIYPTETPGGWHLLGRTPVKPFDPSRPEPVLFRPGDRVRFHRITRSEFDRMVS